MLPHLVVDLSHLGGDGRYVLLLPDDEQTMVAEGVKVS